MVEEGKRKRENRGRDGGIEGLIGGMLMRIVEELGGGAFLALCHIEVWEFTLL